MKRLLSGMQPTGSGRLHLGNYEGALKPWIALQGKYEMYCFIADWHALTTMAGSSDSIADQSREVALDYLSAGLDPNQVAIFRQSAVPQHAEQQKEKTKTTEQHNKRKEKKQKKKHKKT